MAGMGVETSLGINPRNSSTQRPASFQVDAESKAVSVTVMRREHGSRAISDINLNNNDDSLRMEIPFLFRYNETLAEESGDVIGNMWVEGSCYLGETVASPYWNDVLRGANAPVWLKPTHGRYGGVQIVKRIGVMAQKQ